MKIFTLHAGSWDSVHLAGVFSTKENADIYIEKFKITDNPSINEIQLDPSLEILNSDKFPYLVSCTKKTKVKIVKTDLYSSFKENNVHFAFGYMYYFICAYNDKEALEMGEKMKQKVINEDWNSNINLGIQTL